VSRWSVTAADGFEAGQSPVSRDGRDRLAGRVGVFKQYCAAALR